MVSSSNSHSNKKEVCKVMSNRSLGIDIRQFVGGLLQGAILLIQNCRGGNYRNFRRGCSEHCYAFATFSTIICLAPHRLLKIWVS